MIIPFLNAEKYFREAIESVLAQTYTEWELILVDDGSTDGSTQIALDYKNRYEGRVIYTEHEGHLNKGISASRNLGFRSARGNYIAMLDADDAWTKYKLGQQMEIFQTYPDAGMVSGNTKYWYSWTGNPNDLSLDRYMHDNMNSGTSVLNTLVAPPLLLTLTLNGQIDPISMSNIMLKRETIENAGGFEDAFTSMHEDQAFLAKVYLSSPVFVSASCWDFYRQHRESCHQVAEKKGKQESAELFYLEWLENYLKKKDIADPGVRDALN
ncbi:MAG: glycosyltransferase family 2 protein, partial [Candidatus Dadabacteria bacterium]|nr:glycosyltransferase family 2 protein [Candidatus Dadabacteria bacterium]